MKVLRGISQVLVIIGGLNWGILGIGTVANHAGSLNVIHIILKSVPSIETILYILIGIGALILILVPRRRA